MKIAVLHSGDLTSDKPEEFETEDTCEDIEKSLVALGHTPVRVRFSENFQESVEQLRAVRPDIVFNMVEIIGGTDRLAYVAPAVWETLKIPYTGCPTAALAVAASKPKIKKLLRAIGIPTPDYFEFGGSGTGGPWIVKSATEHASLGVDAKNIVGTASEASAIIEAQHRAGGYWFSEKFIDGREYNVYLLSNEAGTGLQVLGSSEILFGNSKLGKPNVYDYKAKWDFDSVDFAAIDVGFDVPDHLARLFAGYAEKLWNALDLRGAARFDLRVDAEGNPYVIDVNLNPCISTGCIFVKAAAKIGISFDEVIRRLVVSARDH